MGLFQNYTAQGWGEGRNLNYIHVCSYISPKHTLLQDLTRIMVTNILEYILHCQLEYLKEQIGLKIYNEK